MKKEKELSHKEMSLKGGMTTLKKHGKKHFAKISKMGVAKRLQKKSTS